MGLVYWLVRDLPPPFWLHKCATDIPGDPLWYQGSHVTFRKKKWARGISFYFPEQVLGWLGGAWAAAKFGQNGCTGKWNIRQLSLQHMVKELFRWTILSNVNGTAVHIELVLHNDLWFVTNPILPYLDRSVKLLLKFHDSRNWNSNFTDNRGRASAYSNSI